LERRLAVFVAKLKTCCRNASLPDRTAAMATRINQPAFYVLTPAIVTAKHLASIGEGDAAFLALLFMLANNCDSALHQIRFSATPASLALLVEFRCRYNRTATSANPLPGSVASSAPARPF
jgi:hypothetical protein